MPLLLRETPKNQLLQTIMTLLTRFLFLPLAILSILPANGANSASGNSSMIELPASLPAPKIDGKSWVLMEYNSGWVVTGHNVDERYAPASITKLMSNYVVFSKLKSGEIDLQDQVSISEKSWRAEGSRMFAEVNSRIELEHLLKSTIIQSGNDAAIALAEHVAGSEEGFAVLMNQAAQRLGMTSSNFMNSTGLPADNHYMLSLIHI